MKLLLLCLVLFGATTAQFSDAAQEAILQLHNDFRSQIAQGNFEVQGVLQPSAKDMFKMKWSDRLATPSQDYANTCPDGPSGTDFGESLYYAWSQKKPKSLDKYGKDAALSWISEFEDFGLSSTLFDQAAKDSGIKEAAQMVWSRTEYVGCGVKNCGPDPDTFTQSYKIIVVCQYSEPGNWIDVNIYEPGDTCTNCGDFTDCDRSTGLCG